MHDSIPDRTARAAVTGLLREQLERALAAEIVIWTGGEPEAVHDFRVAQRRTRVMLREYAGVLEPAAGDLRRALRWLSRQTGPVRDHDMLLERLAARRSTSPRVLTAVETGRGDAFERLLERLAAARYTDLVASWEALATVGSTEAVDPEAFVALTRARLSACAARLLDAIGAVTADPTDDGVHRVRIAAKSVRYLLEFLHDARPSADSAALIDRLKRLQDRLGAFQDLVVHVRMLRALDEEVVAAGLDRRRARIRPGVLQAMQRFARPRNGARLRRLT